MPLINFFNCFLEDPGLKKHNLDSDSLKIALSNTLPLATNSILSDIVEISPGHGYTAGGIALTTVNYAQVSGIAKLTADNPIISASGGTIGPFQYLILYNDTSSTNALIGWYNYGSAFTIADGSSFSVNFDPTNGIFRQRVAP
jgi:hypothetical protein